MVDIVGRDEELSVLTGFVTGTDAGASALVLEGPAGIGKSTLWRGGVEAAREQGLCVLTARPAETEGRLAHAGLGDLLEETLEQIRPALAAPRRNALDVALLREAGEPVEPRALAVAVRSALELLSADDPVLVAVDDVQWLDRSSASALAFALRRLEPGRVRLLLAKRLTEATEPSELEGAYPAEELRRVQVGPLSVGALHRLLHDRLGRSFARQTLLRIHHLAGGNPFSAVEIARVLGAEVDPLAPLPVPQTLDELLRARVSVLPPRTREALAYAAALGAPTEDLLRRLGVDAETLAPAVAEHLVELDAGMVRFSHPLLASAVYADLGPERLSVHRRISEIVEEPLLRARHLALSLTEPDSEVAGTLDGAILVARRRGAAADAAELAEQALRLTPPADAEHRRRRALTAARAEHAAGEWTRARTIVIALLDETDAGPPRAEALVVLSELESVDRAAELLSEALREAAAEPALSALIETRLAWATRFREGFAGAAVHARSALELADAVDDDTLRVRALVVLSDLETVTGGRSLALAERAHALALGTGDDALVHEARVALMATLAAARELDAARTLLLSEYEDARERDELRSGRMLGGLAWIELWAGHLELAADYAARAREIELQYMLERPQGYLPGALIDVYRGRFDVARQQSERALELAGDQLGLQPPYHLAVLGLVELWSGDAGAGAAWLERADRRATELQWRNPSQRPWTGDYVEALLELGRGEEAIRILDVWEADARHFGYDWPFADATRCRGLLAAAAGDVDRALELLEDAVRLHEAAGERFGRARALLTLGTTRRRARQKRPAREAIVAARTLFEELGAAAWADTAARELGRIGGRERESGLTSAERRVAALVAEGRTNREVAAALFLSERTVASHLTHIYAKVGVRSRTELARKVQTF